MCKVVHDITLTNLHNDEVIKHEILLIKGFITKPCHVTDVVLLKKESDTENEQLFNVSKQNGNFKILCQLSSGLNNLTVKYCTKSIKLNCKFEQSNTEYKIQPLYIVCDGHDGNFNSNCEENNSVEACSRITLGLKLVQCLYSEKLYEHGFTRKTFYINSNCFVFKSNLHVDKAKILNEDGLWDEFAKEIINSHLGENEKLKFVAFIGCTEYGPINDDDYSYSNIKRHTKAHAALGGGGLALFGSGTLYSWPNKFQNIIPSFQNNEKINLKKFLDESNYRRTYGGCFASTIGAVCHEMGHIFDLGHTKDGIMGNGFDYVNLVFTNNIRTVDLPNRIVENNQEQKAIDIRLTKLKQPGKFLQKHQEQKIGGDFTFFTKNCALILDYHKWFNFYTNNDESTIDLDVNNFCIKSDNSYLKVIEIREKQNGLVSNYYDFRDEDINVFHLSEIVNFSKYNIFIITSNGSTKLFS